MKTKKSKIIIGSRESKLAVLQSEMVRDYIKEKNPEMEVEILTMKTTGDIILDRTLDKVGGKGLFVKELDKALMDGRSILSVHSLKDMPMEVPEELPLLAFSRREDPRDVLVLPEGVSELNKSKPLGCSSLRRTLQLKKLYPDMEVKSIRGNLQTRLRKLDEGQYSALILAAAGLKRLGLESRISRYFTADEIIPAAGQGILAVQGRKGEDYSFLNGYCDEEAWAVGSAETPIRNTSVPFVSTSARKSISYSFPALLSPVMMWTEEQKSLCVTGTPLYAGTAMEEVTPGTTS